MRWVITLAMWAQEEGARFEVAYLPEGSVRMTTTRGTISLARTVHRRVVWNNELMMLAAEAQVRSMDNLRKHPDRIDEVQGEGIELTLIEVSP
jgi:hypothetical protein